MLNSKQQINEIPMFKYELTLILDTNAFEEETFLVDIFETKGSIYAYLLAEMSTDSYTYVVTIGEEIYVTQYVMQIIYFIEMMTNALDGQGELLPNTLKINIQQYENFYDAYEVANNMKQVFALENN
jgi:hypothetical protein